MGDSTTLTREQLYDLVWQRPVTQLAAEYGLSGVGFAKLCARHNVPTPPRGYWARLHAGQNPPRTRLPPLEDPKPIHLGGGEKPSAEEIKVKAPLFERPANEERVESRIVVSDRLHAPSAVVRRCADALKDAEVTDRGMLIAPPGCLDLQVSKGLLPRALRIADALVKHFDSRGWEVTVTDSSTIVSVDGVPVTLTIQESTEVMELPVEPELTGSYSFHYRLRPTTRKPSGRLSVGIHERSNLWNHSQRRNWRETEHRPMEEYRNDIVIGMLKLAAAVRAEEERRELSAREEQERKRKLQEALDEQSRLQAALAKEKKKIRRLLDQAARWRESENLRLFVAQARERGGLPELHLDSQQFAAWAEWALQQADRLDPFSPSPPSILDESDRIEHMCDGLRGSR